MRALEVLHPGTYASVQDRGRIGYRAQGVAQAGALDGAALELANRLVENAPTAAALELTFGGARLRAHGTARLAFAGAACALQIDGRPAQWRRSYDVADGAIVEIAVPTDGVVSYLAVHGGIDVPVVLGSRSTDAVGGFGGYAGRPLRAGDVLSIGEQLAMRHATADTRASIEEGFEMARPVAIPICVGGEYARFPVATRRAFLETTWQVGVQRNRIGMRLVGPPLASLCEEMNSHAVFPGVVQLPPDGAPIVLLADAPPTGGYPKLGAVPTVVLGRLAQLRPGAALRFRAYDR